MRLNRVHRTIAAVAAATVVGATLAACSGGSDDGGTGGAEGATAEEIEAALEEGGSMTYWTWTPQAEDQVAAFEAAYPNVDVELVDTQGAADNNTALQNAIAAGDGVPDVIQLEYQSIPQFQLPGQLTDLTAFGYADLEDLYTASTWGAVSQNDGIWGLPQDSGPMALFYNKAVFDQYGIEVPATWEEYVEAGRKLHAADPTKWIANDGGDNAGTVTSLVWQAGGKPFQVDGETVTIDLADEGTQKWADMYQPLIDEGLLGNIAGWSDEWFTALGDGTIATLTTGAWMPGVFESGAPAGAGNWRVAPMPTYDGGAAANAENGGSAQVVPAAAENKLLAAGFLKWLNSSEESVELFLASGGFPATVADLQSDEFLSYESEYFGGQKINEVLVAGADAVNPGWSYLPWQSYANSIFTDTVGQAYLDKTSLTDGLAEWQAENATYGAEQGFTVSE